MRILTLEEKAVFDAIVAQRMKGSVIGGTFKYDLVVGQQFLHGNGTSVEYGIDHLEQWNIISRLAKDGIIRMDIMNVYEGGKIAWTFNTDWARKYIQMSMSIEECFKKHGSSIFIDISLDEIRLIAKTCLPMHEAKLSIDKTDSLTLIVSCEGCRYQLKAFDDDSRPHKVFMYAYKKAGELITSKELSKKLGKVIISEDAYICSDVFLRNKTIKKVLSAFVYLKDPHGIRIDRDNILTNEQLEKIKAAAKSVTAIK